MISKAPTEPQDAEEHVSNAGEELSQLCGVIQRIFFKIRESTFDTSISKVETEDDKRYFYKKPREAHVAFDPLPDGLSEDDKAAVLSYMRCAYSVSLMWNIQKLLLKDCTMKEVNGEVAQCPRQTISQDDETRMLTYSFLPATHVLTRLTTSAGQKYALDLTGAQFGHHQTLTPWDQYRTALDFELHEVRSQPTGIAAMGYDGTISWKIAVHMENELKTYIKQHHDDWKSFVHKELDQMLEFAVERAFEEDGSIVRLDGLAVFKECQALGGGADHK